MCGPSQKQKEHINVIRSGTLGRSHLSGPQPIPQSQAGTLSGAICLFLPLPALMILIFFKVSIYISWKQKMNGKVVAVAINLIVK